MSRDKIEVYKVMAIPVLSCEFEFCIEQLKTEIVKSLIYTTNWGIARDNFRFKTD